MDFTREIYDNSIVTDSSWVYSEKLQALKSNAVKGNTTSSVTLNLKEYAENGYVYIICGQMSESKYDYVVIKDQDDNLVEFEIIECKGQPSMIGVRKTTAISESDKFYQFRYVTSNYIKIKLPVRDSYTFSYSKDGSNDYYVDAFWIKTVGTPIFKEPELGEGKERTFTITTNQNIKIPSNVKVTITNNTYYNAEYIFNENNQITVSLPINDEYTITSEDFMIGNKLYLYVVNGNETQVRTMDWIDYTIFITIIIPIVGFISYMIVNKYNPEHIYLDTITTVIGMVAQIMLILRFREQWILWLILDVLCIILWASVGNWCLVMQYVFWTINCVYGYKTWKCK